jgi:hypothetical protein
MPKDGVSLAGELTGDGPGSVLMNPTVVHGAPSGDDAAPDLGLAVRSSTYAVTPSPVRWRIRQAEPCSRTRSGEAPDMPAEPSPLDRIADRGESLAVPVEF